MGDEAGDARKRKASDPNWQSHDHNKSLYLCFETGIKERNEDDYYPSETARYRVFGIKLVDLMSKKCCKSAFETTMRDPLIAQFGLQFSGSCVYGSKIIFAGGAAKVLGVKQSEIETCAAREMFILEADSPGSFMTATPRLDFSVGKFRPIMVDLGGKLYALPGPPLNLMYIEDLRHCFEFFDPEIGRWSCLPQPPYFKRGNNWGSKGLPEAFCVAVVGSSIIVSCPDNQPGRLFVFDTSTSKWTHCDVSRYSFDPFPCHGRNLVVGDDLMFVYNCSLPLTVSVFRISSPSPSGELAFTPIDAVELPADVVPDPQFLPAHEHEFVYLGDQRVGLVLNKHKSPLNDVTVDHEEWMVALIVFRYDCPPVKSKLRSAEGGHSLFNLKVLHTCFFKSDKTDKSHTRRSHVALRGAFLLDTMQSSYQYFGRACSLKGNSSKDEASSDLMVE